MNYKNNLDYDETFEGQKKLEKIVISRKLIRPNTNAKHIVLLSLLIMIICFAFHSFLNILNANLIIKVLVIILFYTLILFELLLRWLFIICVKCYQHYAKETTRRRCMCIPSCSEYAILALKKYELIYALFKIRHRLYKVCKGEIYLRDYP